VTHGDVQDEPVELPVEGHAKHDSGSYSSKWAKQEDIERRLALLGKCRSEGKMAIVNILDPDGQSRKA
jgi:hypothetical protein